MNTTQHRGEFSLAGSNVNRSQIDPSVSICHVELQVFFQQFNGLLSFPLPFCDCNQALACELNTNRNQCTCSRQTCNHTHYAQIVVMHRAEADNNRFGVLTSVLTAVIRDYEMFCTHVPCRLALYRHARTISIRLIVRSDTGGTVSTW